MVGFGVIGLGMGRNRARLIKETAGADLKVVCDLHGDSGRGSSAGIGDRLCCKYGPCVCAR